MRWLLVLLLVPTVAAAEERTITNCHDTYGGLSCTSRTQTIPPTAAEVVLQALRERRAQVAAQPQVIYVPVVAPLPAAPATPKRCPTGGEIYQQDFRYCPEHGVELRAP